MTTNKTDIPLTVAERKVRYATASLLDLVNGDIGQVLDVVELAHYHWSFLNEKVHSIKENVK